MAFDYPPVGFHFLVTFELDGTAGGRDTQWREVNGLNVTVETENFAEGGENRFVHTLPVRTKYADLELKRGLLLDSKVTSWVRDAIENFEYNPTNITISLLNEDHLPLRSWYVVNAFPFEWIIGSLNAEESKLVIENIKLKFQYFSIKN